MKTIYIYPEIENVSDKNGTEYFIHYVMFDTNGQAKPDTKVFKDKEQAQAYYNEIIHLARVSS